MKCLLCRTVVVSDSRHASVICTRCNKDAGWKIYNDATRTIAKLLSRKRYPAALTLLSELLDNPLICYPYIRIQVRIIQADIYFAQHRYDLALSVLQQSIDLDHPELSELTLVRLSMTEALDKLGKQKDAVVLLESLMHEHFAPAFASDAFAILNNLESISARHNIPFDYTRAVDLYNKLLDWWGVPLSPCVDLSRQSCLLAIRRLKVEYERSNSQFNDIVLRLVALAEDSTRLSECVSVLEDYIATEPLKVFRRLATDQLRSISEDHSAS